VEGRVRGIWPIKTLFISLEKLKNGDHNFNFDTDYPPPPGRYFKGCNF
jgi:hypothetical protein